MRAHESIAARFSALLRGDTFDFVDDANPESNSFFYRCRKISGRRYEWTDPRYGRLVAQVGSIHVLVYHVDPEGTR